MLTMRGAAALGTSALFSDFFTGRSRTDGEALGNEGGGSSQRHRQNGRD